MQVEVTTKFKLSDGGTGSLMILDVALLPRGSGNRAAAQRLASQFRKSPELGPHIEKITNGTSRVIVQLRNSPALLVAFKVLRDRARAEQDIPGQLLMQFGNLA